MKTFLTLFLTCCSIFEKFFYLNYNTVHNTASIVNTSMQIRLQSKVCKFSLVLLISLD